MDCFDVVIVGARCAGAVTAMLLARAGLRVLVADRQHSGADTLSGLMIKPDGAARLLSCRYRSRSGAPDSEAAT